MRELAVLTFLTLDGVMQGPTSPEEDPSDGFTQGGWAGPYWEAVMQQVAVEAMAQPYDLLFGRKTYDVFAAHWPTVHPDDPIAARFNAARKYVATSSATHPLNWRNTTRISGDVAAGIAQLKAQDGPLLQVHGSWRLIQTLLEHDLIDEFRLWTFPVTLGDGKRLFGRGAGPADLMLVKTGATANGVVMGIYRRRA